MAYYRCTYTLHNVSGLPRDDVVNTVHFVSDEGAAANPATADALLGRIAAAFADASAGGGIRLARLLSGEIDRDNPPTLRAYDGSDETPGSPLAIETSLGLTAAAQSQALPSEVACCLSFHAAYGALQEFDDIPPGGPVERPKARVRGRFYYGPLNIAAGTATGGEPTRPTAELRNGLINLGQRLFDISKTPTNGFTLSWAVHSKTAGVSLPVVSAWCDDSFDTQRRRGVSATARGEVTYV